MANTRKRKYPCLYDKSSKSYKEKDVIKYAWTKIAEELDFIEDGTSIMNSFTVYVPCDNEDLIYSTTYLFCLLE